MTPAEADQRVILSRRVLAGWIAVGPDEGMEDVLRRIHSEISTLEALAEEHPSKMKKLVTLAMEWMAFREKLRARLN